MVPAQPLKTEECEILRALTAATTAAGRTTAVVARHAGMTQRELAGWLHEMGSRSPPLIEPVDDEEFEIQWWRPTLAGIASFEAGCD